MNIIKNLEGTKLALKIEGRLDTTTAPELEQVVTGELSGITELAINMEELEYISSAGLRVLLKAQKTMSAQGKMTVMNVNETIKEVFEMTGFDGILNII